MKTSKVIATFMTGLRFGTLMLGLTALTANAGVIFCTSSGTFNPAVGSFTLRGVEDWSSATATSLTFLSDPLSPGVPKGPFPNGSSVAVGIRVQSNSLRNNPTNTAPGNGMAYAPAGYVGFSGNVQPSKQLSANGTNDSFDIIFNTLSNRVSRAVSLSPVYYRIYSGNDSATLTVRVYNQANVFLGSTPVPNVQDCLETAYLGIVTTGGDTLGRVNIWATTQDAVGADNIAVYGAPPASPTLLSANRSANNFAFTLDGQAGQRYAITTSTNLVTWQSVQTNTLLGNSIPLTFTTTNRQRFYRAQWVP